MRDDERWREWVLWGCFIALAIVALAAGFGDDLSRLASPPPATAKAAGN